MSDKPYTPRAFFSGFDDALPRVLLSPQKYVQGPAYFLDRLGDHLALLSVRRAAALGSERCLANEGKKAIESMKRAEIDVVIAQFHGECSVLEIEAQAESSPIFSDRLPDSTGWRQTVDAGGIAHRLNVPSVVAPTLASNDAPCSALSVVYTPEGVQESVEYFARSPSLVIVDTNVVTEADERYLVAGMGDAIATWYEARISQSNPKAITPAGARPSLAAYAISEICAQTIYEVGEAAAESVAVNKNDDNVEKVVEANTLLSGIGLESGGLAMVHPLALAYTRIDRVHENYLHGEIVAISTMAQLALEKSDDLDKAAVFFSPAWDYLYIWDNFPCHRRTRKNLKSWLK